jgi:GT2 family glycosyltransferase
MPIDVVVCVHNAPDDVRLCLESIDRHRRGENLRLILVDDGSGPRTQDYLAGFARDRLWVCLIRNEAAVGYSHAARIGVGESVAEFVIVLNSDTIVTDGWAEKLADALVSTKGAGIVGPLSNAAGKQSIPETRGSGQQSAVNRLPAGIGPDEMNRHCEEWTVDGILPRVSRIHGFCLGIHRRVLDTVDFFDVENFPRGYGEEDDFCLRAGEAGFGLVIATHTFVYHAKSRSFATEERVQLMRQGAATLVRLHGADRVNRTGEASSLNPILERIRREAYRLYRTPWQAPEQHVDGGPAQVRDADAATGHDAEAR